MSTKSAIATSLPENGLRTEREQSPQPVLCEVAREVFSDGVKAWGYADAFAAEQEISKGNLSEMMSGSRHVQFRHVLGLLKSEAAARVVLGRQAQYAGFGMPQPLTTIRLDLSEARLLAEMRRLHGETWKYFGRELAARRYQVALDLLDAAIDFAIEAHR